jgi:hypothetical protein
MKKPKKIETWKLILSYICPVTEKQVEVEVNEGGGPARLIASDSPCELCGSHGGIDIETPFACPECKGNHGRIEFSSW